MKLVNLSSTDALVLTLGTLAGGVLPDIDLKYSTPGKALFMALGVLLALAWLFAHVQGYAALELWAVAVLIFLLVRYPLWWLFHQFTVHRGSLHSLVAGLMFGAVTSAGSFQLLGQTPLMSWLSGAFVAAGYLLHLLLDELFAVDFLGARISNRLGTALKPIDTERLFASCLILFITLVAWFWTPPAASLQDAWQAVLARSTSPWADALLPYWW